MRSPHRMPFPYLPLVMSDLLRDSRDLLSLFSNIQTYCLTTTCTARCWAERLWDFQLSRDNSSGSGSGGTCPAHPLYNVVSVPVRMSWWQYRYVPMFGEAQYRQERAYASAPLEEQLEAVSRLVSQGKVRHFGVSNETPWGVMQFLHLCAPNSFPLLLYRAFSTKNLMCHLVAVVPMFRLVRLPCFSHLSLLASLLRVVCFSWRPCFGHWPRMACLVSLACSCHLPRVVPPLVVCLSWLCHMLCHSHIVPLG